MRRFKPVRQPRISQEVLRQIKEAILLGYYKSGEKLPSERKLTEEFQVSRGVIREAIRALEITGFVVTRQGPAGGAFVTELSFSHVGNAFLDLFLANRVSIPEMAHVRSFVEPEVARSAALNITKEGGERLLKAHDAWSKDSYQVVRADIGFPEGNLLDVKPTRCADKVTCGKPFWVSIFMTL